MFDHFYLPPSSHENEMITPGNIHCITVMFWYSFQKYRYAIKFIHKIDHLLLICMLAFLFSSDCPTRKVLTQVLSYIQC